MSETFSLGRIAGIRVGVNASVLVIVLIIAGGLAFGRFPLVLPGRGAAAYVVAALAAALAFLASLLAHELAHALVARRNGVEVEGITLWLLGGVARLRGGARTPGAEFRIAGVGPLTSLLLGVLFAGGALVAVKAHKDIRVEIGERVAMHVPLAACHLFDATTGERLRASP